MNKTIVLLLLLALVLAACAGPKPDEQATGDAQQIAITVYESPT